MHSTSFQWCNQCLYSCQPNPYSCLCVRDLQPPAMLALYLFSPGILSPTRVASPQRRKAADMLPDWTRNKALSRIPNGAGHRATPRLCGLLSLTDFPNFLQDNKSWTGQVQKNTTYLYKIIKLFLLQWSMHGQCRLIEKNN